MKLSIITAPRRDSRHWKATKISWAEICEWMDDPADRKEAGNYVLGTFRETTVTHDTPTGPGTPCTGLHRRKEAVATRSALTLDVDSPDPDFLDKLNERLAWRAVVHTTWRSTPDAPRYRLIVAVDRDMLPDEYAAAAAALMDQLGAGQFDPGSVQPERYMFMPSAPKREWFRHLEITGPPASVDDLLSDWNPDLSTIPLPKPSRNKRSPYELSGAVGAFNRAYPIEDVIREFDLPYEEAGGGRWHLVGAGGAAGMGEVSDGLVYSHHAADPAAGTACSAFDLVRLHRFGHLDDGIDTDKTPVNRRPSHQAMLDLAAGDARTVAEMVGVDFAKDMSALAATNAASAPSPTASTTVQSSGAPAWRTGLRMNARTGKFIDCIPNWDLIKKHDPAFAGLYYNELSMAIETSTDLPWRKVTEGSRETFIGPDRSEMAHYLEREYEVRPARTLVDELIETTAHRRRVNPVRDYLEALVWDGTPRVETCLPGVAPTPYTRMVARKSMVAAVARMFNPGVKWDHTLVLYGPEGLGKSFWIDRMARGYSASMGSLGDKDTLITMQRSWILVADEGHSLRKADAEQQKEFLTRTEDVFRMPYDRESQVHKRHCVVWSTTNDEVFLRRQEGNRRFLIVRCEEKVDFDALTPEYVDQVWAEAVHLYRSGELLFLEDIESQTAAAERENFTEEDALAGVLAEHLDIPVPDGWDAMGISERRQYFSDRSMGIGLPGDQRQDRTCSTQLWVEALGNEIGRHRRTDLLEITAIMKQMPGWRRVPGRHRVPGYGLQVVFERVDEEIL